MKCQIKTLLFQIIMHQTTQNITNPSKLIIFLKYSLQKIIMANHVYHQYLRKCKGIKNYQNKKNVIR